jgi:uncharacterized protein (TIGR00375 family)
VFDPRTLERLPAVELGLSADTDMADMIDELAAFTLLSNSDAHSRRSIAREYNVIEMESPDFRELSLALRRLEWRRVVQNVGLDPRLGKYHRSFCLSCGRAASGAAAVEVCPCCGSGRVVRGVWDRARQIASRDKPLHPPHRPPYVRQVPLAFIPGIGPAMLDRLIRRFGSEMNVVHRASERELASVAGERVARAIVAAREGMLSVTTGAGGFYGSVDFP